MQQPTRYSTYPVPYVSALERHKAAALVLIGLLLGIMLYGACRAVWSLSEHRAEVNILNNQIDLLELELAELQDYREEKEKAIEKGRQYIQRHNPKIASKEAEKLAKWEIEAGRRHGVPARIMFAISRKESHWMQNAVSPTGPCGIKQVATSWWTKRLGMSRAELCGNAEKNIEAGARIIAIHYQDTGSWLKALQRYYGDEDPTVNQAYAVKVMTLAMGY